MRFKEKTDVIIATTFFQVTQFYNMYDFVIL